MENKNNIGLLLIGFITIIVSIVFLNAIANNIAQGSLLTVVTNESVTTSSVINSTVNETITITSGSGAVANINLINLSFFGNGTNNTMQPTGIAPVLGAEVNFTKNGTIRVSQMIFGDGSYNASYIFRTRVTAQMAEDDKTGLVLTFFGNATTNTNSAGISIGTDVNVSKTGLITATPYNFTTGTYNASATYKGDQYVDNATARTLNNITLIFLAIVILLTGVGMAMSALKGIFNF